MKLSEIVAALEAKLAPMWQELDRKMQSLAKTEVTNVTGNIIVGGKVLPQAIAGGTTGQVLQTGSGGATSWGPVTAPSFAATPAHLALIGPTSGTAVPTFRLLVPGDIPSLPAGQITSGTFAASLLPLATGSTAGAVQPDGSTITVAGGILTAHAVGSGGATALAAYDAARPITVTTTTAVTGSTTTPVAIGGTDYVVRVYLTGATAAAVYGLLAYADGSDLAVFWTDGAGAVHQLDVDVETVGATGISLWFRLQQNIGASSTDASYTLAYGNPNPVVLHTLNNIYPFWDDFNTGSLDTSKWTNYNGCIISFSGSIMTVKNSVTLDIAHNNCAVQSIHQYAAGYALRARGTMPMPAITNNPHVHNSLRFNNGDSSQLAMGVNRCEASLIADPGDGFSASPGNFPSDWVVVSFSDGHTTPFQDADLQAVDAATHTFNLGRAPGTGNGIGWIDEGAAATSSYAACTTAGFVWMAPTGDDIANTTQQSWDWIKIRPFVAAEPVASVGAESTTWARAGVGNVAVSHGGAAVGTRPALNLIDGAGAALTVSDNPGANRVDVAVAANVQVAAKGDLLTYDTAPTKIGVSGVNGRVLTEDATVPKGIRWRDVVLALEQLSNLFIDNLQDGDSLSYSAALDGWINSSAGFGATVLDDVSGASVLEDGSGNQVISDPLGTVLTSDLTGAILVDDVSGKRLISA